MKKTTLSLILLVFAHVLFAQEGTTNIGFNIGFAEPTEYYRAGNADTKLTRDATNGIRLGFIYETGIIKGFGVSMSLNYTFSTNVEAWTPTPGMVALQTKEDHFVHTLELPVDWQYKFLIAKNTYLALYTGPTLQIGLSNIYHNRTKLNNDILADNRYSRYALNIKGDEDADNIRDYNRVNVTWGIGLGFQYKQYFLRGGYDFGIMPLYHDRFYNISTDDGWNRNGRLDQWQIKLGIYLWQLD